MQAASSPGDCTVIGGNTMLVILNPSPVILNPSLVILNEVKNLCHWLRVNSVKNLIHSVILNEVKDLGSSFALLRRFFGCCLRMTLQHSLLGEDEER
jgi:hypothetical protein